MKGPGEKEFLEFFLPNPVRTREPRKAFEQGVKQWRLF